MAGRVRLTSTWRTTSSAANARRTRWWGGVAQNGWGVAINQQYRTIFAVWYTYDPVGRTVWYLVPGGEWIAANVYRGAAYRTTSSAWLGAIYNPAAFVANSAGTVTFTFNDAEMTDAGN